MRLIVASIDIENDFPPYLRGIGWRNVEKELRKDMRLTSNIRPISYEIHLNVDVRGYRRAQRSTFDGTVVIALNVSSSTDKIELHSVGLNIKKAELTTSSTVVRITKIEYNRERETANFTLAQPLQPTTNAQLKIHYTGKSQMRGIGLYESWTTKYPLPLPTISLVTNCEPTGARRWFPGFDEPDKKATFRLTIIHPTQLKAYSNTAGTTKIFVGSWGLSETTFQPTSPLPTYVVALALSDQSTDEVMHNNQKIRVIGRWYSDKLNRLAKSIDYVKSRPAFHNITFISEKTDWMVVDDFPVGAMENPGLITSTFLGTSSSIQVHELAHMYFGNLVTLRSWEQIWINEGFATFFQNMYENNEYQIPSKYILRSASIHDPAMHSEFSYTRSQFAYDRLIKNTKIHYSKAAQLISLVRRFIGEKYFNCALNRYLAENSFGNGDSEMMIYYLSMGKPEVRQILQDWVYQAGVAILSVDREETRAIIQQRRFLRTDFNKELRDTKTRWTIPLYYTVNDVEYMTVFRRGVGKLIVNFPSNSTFSIDESYPYLYAVQYKNSIQKDSVINAIQYETSKAQKPSEAKITDSLSKGFDYIAFFCKNYAGGKTKEQIWKAYLGEKDYLYLLCDETLQTRDSAKRFLFDLLVSNDLAIRNSDIGRITQLINNRHSDILLEFLAEENQNIDFLDKNISEVIKMIAKEESNGVEKLREIVRVNPSFAANFYHMFTKIFEEDFIEREMRIFKPSIDDDFSYSYYY